jgi:hypothetical protein
MIDIYNPQNVVNDLVLASCLSCVHSKKANHTM